MANHEPLSSTDIMSRVGIERNVMTFWTRGGVLQPIEAQERNFRFPWYEANIAAIMNQLRVLGVRIDGMLSICRIYREAIAFFDELGLSRDEVYGLWSLFIITGNHVHRIMKIAEYQAMVDTPGFDAERFPTIVAAAQRPTEEEEEEELKAAMLEAGNEKHGAKRLTARIVDLYETITKEDFYKHLDAYLTVTEQPTRDDVNYDGHLEELTYYWRVGQGDEYRFAWGAGAGGKASKDGARAMIAVDVTAVLSEVWNRPGDKESSA